MRGGGDSRSFDTAVRRPVLEKGLANSGWRNVFPALCWFVGVDSSTVEQHPFKLLVPGSNPGRPTILCSAAASDDTLGEGPPAERVRDEEPRTLGFDGVSQEGTERRSRRSREWRSHAAVTRGKRGSAHTGRTRSGPTTRDNSLARSSYRPKSHSRTACA